MKNELQQTFFKYVTTPLAKAIDFVNIPKRIKLKKRRERIALENKHNYIEMTSKLLFEQDIQEHLAKGEMPHPLMLPLIISRHIDQAYEMFYEKKANGDFDELNILIK